MYFIFFGQEKKSYLAVLENILSPRKLFEKIKCVLKQISIDNSYLFYIYH